MPLNAQSDLTVIDAAGEVGQNGALADALLFSDAVEVYDGVPADMGVDCYLLITVGVLLFGLSTTISWSYYGDRSTVYLFGPAWVAPYKVVFCVMHFLGAIFSLEIVWKFGDSALGLMSLPNLIALILLAGMARKMANECFGKEQRPRV